MSALPEVSGDVNDSAVRAAVEALLSEAFWYHDHEMLDEQLALYAPGFEVRTPGGTFRGEAEYRHFLQNRHGPDEFSMHYVTNVRVVTANAERVAFRYYLVNPLQNVAALGGGDVFGIAEGSDLAVWDQGRLRFIERELTVRTIMARADRSDDGPPSSPGAGEPSAS